MAGNISYDDLEGNERKGFKAAVTKAMKEQYGEDIDGSEPGQTTLQSSGIRPMPAEDQIRKYLREITPTDRPTSFRLEWLWFGIAAGAVLFGVLLVLWSLALGG